MIKLLKQKWVFRLAVLTPIFYLTYNLITGGINNANPLQCSGIPTFDYSLDFSSPSHFLPPKDSPIRIFNIHKSFL